MTLTLATALTVHHVQSFDQRQTIWIIWKQSSKWTFQIFKTEEDVFVWLFYLLDLQNRWKMDILSIFHLLNLEALKALLHLVFAQVLMTLVTITCHALLLILIWSDLNTGQPELEGIGMLLGSKMDKILCSDQKWFDRLVYWGKGQNMCLFLRALKSMQSAIFELLANHIYKYTLSIIFKTLSVVEGLTRADHLGSRYKA